MYSFLVKDGSNRELYVGNQACVLSAKPIECACFIRTSQRIKTPYRSAGLSDQSSSQGWGSDLWEMRLDWETPGRRGHISTG